MSEVERLRDWKESALHVLAQWDGVYAALGSPGGLGMSKPAAARAEVERLRAEVAEHLLRADSLRAELRRTQDENERLYTELHLGQDEAKRLRAAVQAVRDLAEDPLLNVHGEMYVALPELLVALAGGRP